MVVLSHRIMALLLLCGVNRQIGLSERLATAFKDQRHVSYIDHPLQELMAQRVYQVISGYEDANDANHLPANQVFKLGVGRRLLEKENPHVDLALWLRILLIPEYLFLIISVAIVPARFLVRFILLVSIDVLVKQYHLVRIRSLFGLMPGSLIFDVCNIVPVPRVVMVLCFHEADTTGDR